MAKYLQIGSELLINKYNCESILGEKVPSVAIAAEKIQQLAKEKGAYIEASEPYLPDTEDWNFCGYEFVSIEIGDCPLSPEEIVHGHESNFEYSYGNAFAPYDCEALLTTSSEPKGKVIGRMEDLGIQEDDPFWQFQWDDSIPEHENFLHL